MRAGNAEWFHGKVPMSIQIIIKPSPDELAPAVGEWLIDAIQSVLRVRSTCSIALSGGSTPKRLYEWIAEYELHCLDWSRVQLLWGDERNVPHDDPESNYRMVREAWLDRAEQSKEPRCMPQVFPVPIQLTVPERAAKEYADTICELLGESPRIDIVLLGLGDDSHTASLFPETTALAETEEFFVASFVPKFGTYRMTMTLPLINAAHSIAFLVCGSSKQAAVDVVWHGPRQGNQYPAQMIQPTAGDIFWFLDAAAVPEHRRNDYQP